MLFELMNKDKAIGKLKCKTSCIRLIAIVIIIVLLLLLISFGHKNYTQGNIEDSQRTYAETALQKIEQSVKGNVYERTPNNFVKGVNLDFSGKSLESLKVIVADMVFSENSTEEDGETKYRIRLYDTDGNLMLDFGIYDNDEVWCQRKQIKNPESLIMWLEQMKGR